MIYFHNDYSEGCHPKVLEKLIATNFEQTPGYGEDIYCLQAAESIRKLCSRNDLAVHFLVGGTQANLTVIAAALRPHQAALGAVSAHINVHETGAVEATGHKVLSVPSADGKITAAQVRSVVETHRASGSFEHEAQPKLVYISNPTELGTLYTLSELEELSASCKEFGLYLFLDGARLGYGLAAADNDVTLPDIARLCDVFYIGGTKVGALFGEAVVFTKAELGTDFRSYIKQNGAMLAKGWLLGLQFYTLFKDGLYFDITKNAVQYAMQIKEAFAAKGIPAYFESPTNQQFVVIENSMMAKLDGKYVYEYDHKVDDTHSCIRFCTSWSTKPEDVQALIADIQTL